MKDLKNKKELFIFGAMFLLILVIGGAYAYFQIIANNNATTTTISGQSELVGQVTLNTNITQLKLDLTPNIMNKDNIGKMYYATENGVGVESSEVTDGNGRYTLATANVTESDVSFVCSYSYVISATTTTGVTDASDEDLKVVITEIDGKKTTYTLKELLTGVTHSGKMKNLTYGQDSSLKIEAYIENTSDTQNDLSGNEYLITISPNSGDEGFSCDIYKPTFAEKLIINNILWNSGLEEDGYRYVGKGGTHASTPPSNYICFGTTSKDECTSTTADDNGLTGVDKYMYRIIGAFPDDNGEYHLKLIKQKQIGPYSWDENYTSNILWEKSQLYQKLNGEYFLTNSNYSYLQDDLWLNKIEDWKWTAVNTMQTSAQGTTYSDSLALRYIYLHEMNRSTKTVLGGSWTYPTAKIGLMYVSDYILALGEKVITMNSNTINNAGELITSWIHMKNKDNSKDNNEWFISRAGNRNAYYSAYSLNPSGSVGLSTTDAQEAVSPTFYLISNINFNDGTGTIDNPYIIS